MVESNHNKPEVTLRYFPLKEDYVFAQFQTKMTQRAFNALTGSTPDVKLKSA